MHFCHTPEPQTFMKSWRYVSFGKLVMNDRKISHLYKISRKSGCSSFQGVCWSEQTCCFQVFVQPKGRTGKSVWEIQGDWLMPFILQFFSGGGQKYPVIRRFIILALLGIYVYMCIHIYICVHIPISIVWWNVKRVWLPLLNFLQNFTGTITSQYESTLSYQSCLVFPECQIAGIKIATLLDFFTASKRQLWEISLAVPDSTKRYQKGIVSGCLMFLLHLLTSTSTFFVGTTWWFSVTIQ